MQAVFKFNKKIPIFIYGCSGTGIVFYKQLKKYGYSVCGFFDKNAHSMKSYVEIEGNMVPIYTVEEYKIDLEEKSFLVILIAIRNAVEQTKVAQSLQLYGYNNCIYFPLVVKNKYNKDAINCMQEFYNGFMGGIVKNSYLPKQAAIEYNKFGDQALISEDKESIIALVPVSLIYLESAEYLLKQKTEFKIASQKGISEYADKNIVTYSGLIEMFKLFQSGNGNVEFFLKRMENNGLAMQKESSLNEQRFLRDRQECFCYLSESLNKGLVSFADLAAYVQWNQNGYFNILDGRHRVLFFYVKGIDKVPAKMRKKDYNTWLNKSVVKKCEKYLSGHKDAVLTAPIQHPCFYHVKSHRENYGKTVLSSIQEFIGIKDMNDKTVLDIQSSEGYFAQHFSRMGARVYAVESNKEKFELANILNELYQVPKIVMINKDIFSFDFVEKFNIVLAFKVISLYSKVEQLNVLRRIDNITKEELFWESGYNIEDEKEFILKNSTFKYYEKIRNTFDGKCIGELGVFKK